MIPFTTHFTILISVGDAQCGAVLCGVTHIMEVVLATVMVTLISVEVFTEVADSTAAASIMEVVSMMEAPHPLMADAVTMAEEVNVEV